MSKYSLEWKVAGFRSLTIPNAAFMGWITADLSYLHFNSFIEVKRHFDNVLALWEPRPLSEAPSIMVTAKKDYVEVYQTPEQLIAIVKKGHEN